MIKNYTRREYQVYTLNEIFRHFATHLVGNPVVPMPTGTGKSITIAELIAWVMDAWNDPHVLILAPTKELVVQDAEKLAFLAPDVPYGICSASLNRFEWTKKVTFGTIGTVINRKENFPRLDLVIVDEAHLVSDVETTQYRKLFDYLIEKNPNTRFVGLSATPYRMGLGHITDGGLFTHVVADSTNLDAFNWYIEQGFMVPLIPQPTRLQLDTSKVKLQAGEFQALALQTSVNKPEVTAAALREAQELAYERNHILVFTTGIEHCEDIVAELQSMGEDAVLVHSKITDKERDENIRKFLSGEVRWCVNYGVLTTGFDFPALDCIVMLRPTRSPGLWVQMGGRGTRVDYADGFDLSTQQGRLAAIAASDKQNCLLLDFAYNTMQLGPINDPQLPRRRGEGGGEAPVKICGATSTTTGQWNIIKGTSRISDEGCNTWCHPTAKFCLNCGAEFIFALRFESQASVHEVLAKPAKSKAHTDPIVVVHPVNRVTYNIHRKEGAPPSIRATYHCGMRKFSHFILPEHQGYARRRSEQWWLMHGGASMPETTIECSELVDDLAVPARIHVWENKKYPEVMHFEFGDPVVVDAEVTT